MRQLWNFIKLVMVGAVRTMSLAACIGITLCTVNVHAAIPGDVCGTADVDISDALCTLRYVVELIPHNTANDAIYLAADVAPLDAVSRMPKGNTTVDLSDALGILRHVVNLDTWFNFTQADLTGTWNFIKFSSGPGVVAGTEPGWMRGNVTINASGGVTVNSISSSSGAISPPPAGAITETIDANGVITEGGDPVFASGPENHAVMSANKMIAVGTSGGSSGNRSFRIFVKQVGTFSPADISSGTLTVSQLTTGASNGWNFGTGTINAAQQVALTSSLDNNGNTSLPPANFLTFAITAAGIVTTGGSIADPTFQGVMTPDKKLIIGTETDSVGNTYKLTIAAIGGQTFTTADLAGTWSAHSITSAPAPVWEYKTFSISSTGDVTILTFKASNGNTVAGAAGTLSVGPTGLITMVGEPSLHGVMAFGKNFAVATSTQNPGVFDMDILVK